MGARTYTTRVEALQYLDIPWQEVMQFSGTSPDDLVILENEAKEAGELSESLTLEDGQWVDPGDWVVRMPNGEFLVFPDVAFKASFEAHMPAVVAEREEERGGKKFKVSVLESQVPRGQA